MTLSIIAQGRKTGNDIFGGTMDWITVGLVCQIWWKYIFFLKNSRNCSTITILAEIMITAVSVI